MKFISEACEKKKCKYILKLKFSYMKNNYLLASLIVALFFISLNSDAQDESMSNSPANSSIAGKSFGLVNTTYNSDIVFLGRKSSSRAPYISVQTGYYHKSGLYINGSVSYLAASGEKRIDLFTSSAGYDYYQNKFSSGISGASYFFNNKSYTAKSALTGSLNAYAGYDFDILEVYLDGTAYFSNNTDFVLGLTIGHPFFAADGNLKIIPSVYLNAGTQNYYGDYDNNSRFGRHMLNGGVLQSQGTGMMGYGKFNMLDYEIGVPVSYTLNKFRFSFYPVYAIPVNAASITNNQDTYREDLNNSFFWSLGISYQILKK